MKIKVTLKKKYCSELIKHYITLGETPCSCKSIEGLEVHGCIVGVSRLNESIQLLVVDKNETLYNRNINEVHINGKFKEVK